MFQFIENELGTKEDQKILIEEAWLHTAQVSYQITHKRSRWCLSILFINQKNPMRLRLRYLDDYSSEKQAQCYAQLFQRGIQRDARGTFKTNNDAFNFCKN
jgi:hypothetical protein